MTNDHVRYYMLIAFFWILEFCGDGEKITREKKKKGMHLTGCFVGLIAALASFGSTASSQESTKLLRKSEVIPLGYVSTGPFAPPGTHITSQFGIVQGITFRSRDAISNKIAHWTTWGGGEIESLRQFFNETRTEAYNMMVEEANMIGANGVIAVNYEAHDVFGGAEVICYGTAVRIDVL